VYHGQLDKQDDDIAVVFCGELSQTTIEHSAILRSKTGSIEMRREVDLIQRPS
jgi:hypothetical protein